MITKPFAFTTLLAVLQLSLAARKRSVDSSGPHLPLCEELAGPFKDVPNMSDYYKNAEAKFTEAEILASRNESGILTATCQEKPTALWILGPGAVGKTTVTNDWAEKLGIKKLPSGHFDAITLDGDIWRDHHQGFLQLTKLAVQHKCISKKAWDTVVKLTKKLKAGMAKESTDGETTGCFRNLIIAETCSKFVRCYQQMKLLERLGFEIHVISVAGSHEAVRERGMKRADETGKFYTGTFEAPTAAFAPMMSLGNGKCILVNNTNFPGKIVSEFHCPETKCFSPDPAKMPDEINNVREKVLEIANVDKTEYAALQKKMSKDFDDCDDEVIEEAATGQPNEQTHLDESKKACSSEEGYIAYGVCLVRAFASYLGYLISKIL